MDIKAYNCNAGKLTVFLTITIGLGTFLIVLLSIFHFEDIPKFKIMVKNGNNGNNGEKDNFLKMRAGGDEKLIYNKYWSNSLFVSFVCKTWFGKNFCSLFRNRACSLSSAELSRLFNSAKRRSINYDFINVNKREALDCNE